MPANTEELQIREARWPTNLPPESSAAGQPLQPKRTADPLARGPTGNGDDLVIEGEANGAEAADFIGIDQVAAEWDVVRPSRHDLVAELAARFFFPGVRIGRVQFWDIDQALRHHQDWRISAVKVLDIADGQLDLKRHLELRHAGRRYGWDFRPDRGVEHDLMGGVRPAPHDLHELERLGNSGSRGKARRLCRGRFAAGAGRQERGNDREAQDEHRQASRSSPRGSHSTAEP
jgi:hypothetical protein